MGGSGGLTLGWEFQVTNTNGILVDGLGFWDYQSDGFFLSQTFDVGLWDPSTGTLLRESVVSSTSPLKSSLDADGGWRVNSVSPLFLAPGSYRVGALMPVSGANQIVSDPATFQCAPGITFVQFLRQIGSPTLAMPDTGPPYSGAMWFGPTFTFTLGPWAPTGTNVAPVSYTATPGTTGLNTLLRNSGNPRTYQMQFSAAALAGLPVGAKITELRFRLQNIPVAAFPTNNVNWSDYEVTLAQAAYPISSMSTYFTSNMRSPVSVKSGALSLTANTFTAGASPNGFGSFIVFDRPYVYQGGDLVMHFSHPGSDSATTAYLDALTTTTTGYGTDFRALSASSYAANTGAAASATIVQIVFTYSPGQTISCNGTNVVVVGAGGPPGGTYHLMACTNSAWPMSQWTPVAASQFDVSGGFHYTNALNATSPALFFRIALP